MECMGPGEAKKFKLKGSGVCQKNGNYFLGGLNSFNKFIPRGV